MSEFLERYQKNIERVENLNKLFTLAKNTNRRPTIKEADILRASVVFLHSAFEDYFRAVIVNRLPKIANDEALKNISLLDSDTARAEKFSLSALKRFQDKSINYIIEESVKQHMSKVSFNDYTEICSWANKIGISLENYTKPRNIDLLISRRHKIVHEADSNNTLGRGYHRATAISLPTVTTWIAASNELVTLIDAQL